MKMERERNDSQFFIVPADFFHDLQLELLKIAHDKEDVGRAMFNLGRSTVINISNSDLFSDFGSRSFEDVMHLHWPEVGLGMMSIWTGGDGTYIIQNKRGTEALAKGYVGEPSCHFSRGYLAGLAFVQTGLNYTTVEKECMCQGFPHCTFLLQKI